QKVCIILDVKTLKPALIDMYLAARPVLGPQPHRVRKRNPLLMPSSSVVCSTKCQ
ncbi:MAG: hypothetical protein RLY70_732, partial [Planctomycetota bacterium]